MALSRHGSGSLITLSRALEARMPQLTSFVLEGVAAEGPLAAAAWDSEGLLLMTAAGVSLDCPGVVPAAHGRWHCAPLPGAKLPISLPGKALVARVAVSRDGSHGL